MKKLGTWWNDHNIEIYEIEGKRLALYGWNGEEYTECWEVSEDLIDVISKEDITVKPIYKEVSEDEFEIIDYEII